MGEGEYASGGDEYEFLPRGDKHVGRVKDHRIRGEDDPGDRTALGNGELTDLNFSFSFIDPTYPE